MKKVESNVSVEVLENVLNKGVEVVSSGVSESVKEVVKEVTTVEKLINKNNNSKRLLSPDLISFDESTNIRMEYGDIEGLANSIAENGVLQDIWVKKNVKTGMYDAIDGFRRGRALKLLKERGIKIASVPVFVVESTYTEENRLFAMFLTQDNKKLTNVEEGMNFLKLTKYGYSPEKIAKQIGRAISYVSDMILLAKAPEMIRTEVSEGLITANTAVNIIKTSDDMEEAKAVVEIIKEEVIKNPSLKTDNKPLKANKALGIVSEVTGKNVVKSSKKPVEKVIEGTENDKKFALNNTSSSVKVTTDEPKLTNGQNSWLKDMLPKFVIFMTENKEVKECFSDTSFEQVIREYNMLKQLDKNNHFQYNIQMIHGKRKFAITELGSVI